MSKLISFAVVCIFVLASSAWAAKFKGFERKPHSELETFNEPVDRFEETDKEFQILFAHHPSFYRLPKVKDYEGQVRTLLQNSAQLGKPLSIELNPVTTEIYFIGTKD